MFTDACRCTDCFLTGASLIIHRRKEMTESTKVHELTEAMPTAPSTPLMSASKTAGLMAGFGGKWAGRWVKAAVVQGAIAAIATVLIIAPLSYFNISLYFNPGMVIAGGGGGTWLFTGYIIYLVVGVLAVAATGGIYLYFEGVLGRVFHGFANYLAWGHYLLMNVGAAGSMILMMYGGYLAGWAGASKSAGGLGYTDYQIHTTYLVHFEDPIGALALIAVLGLVLGGLGFILDNRARKKSAGA